MVARLMARLLSPQALVGPLASLVANSATASPSRSSGTTWLTKPQSSASCAVTARFVRPS